MKFSCFTMLYYFLLYSQVNQIHTHTHIYVCPLCQHRALSSVPCAALQVLLCFLFSYIIVSIYIYLSQSPSPSQPSPTFSLAVHTFVLYLCVSISALQIGSSVPFFYIPHTRIYINYSLCRNSSQLLCSTIANRWGNKGNNDRLYFGGLQNYCRWWLQPRN